MRFVTAVIGFRYDAILTPTIFKNSVPSGSMRNEQHAHHFEAFILPIRQAQYVVDGNVIGGNVPSKTRLLNTYLITRRIKYMVKAFYQKR